MKSLVLSGGGARGAYQVGVIQAIAEIANENQLKNPFQLFCGVSAGAINAAFMASHAEDFTKGSQAISKLWAGLNSSQVFKTDALSMGKIGLQWMGELSIGAFSGTSPGRALLDTEPLLHLIRKNLNFSKIQENLNSHKLKALCITALDYQTSETISFVQGTPEIPNWVRNRRRSEKVTIQAEHIMASSAIPLLFPPRAVGNRFFGDGCVRNFAPLSPALHLGSQELFVIGVRQQSEVSPQDLSSSPRSPSAARVINVILNSVLLDGIEVDMERLLRINEFLRRVPQEHQANLNFKPVRTFFISPSQDIGKIAAQMSSRLPRVIRYLLKGLGPLEDAAEIISYLLFETEFTSKLVEIGYEDGMNKKAEISRFLLESRPQSLDWEGF